MHWCRCCCCRWCCWCCCRRCRQYCFQRSRRLSRRRSCLFPYRCRRRRRRRRNSHRDRVAWVHKGERPSTDFLVLPPPRFRVQVNHQRFHRVAPQTALTQRTRHNPDHRDNPPRKRSSLCCIPLSLLFPPNRYLSLRAGRWGVDAGGGCAGAGGPRPVLYRRIFRDQRARPRDDPRGKSDSDV